MVRGAIIGFGNVAVHGHLPTWLARRDVEIVAAVDSCATRRLEMTQLLPDRHWYESADALFAAERLDFLDICSPPATHASWIRGALERGIHVLCEKPLVCRREDLAELVRLVGTTDKALYTVHNWRQAPIVQLVQDLL